MILTFNDNSVLEVDYIENDVSANAINITVATDDYNSLKSMFMNKEILSSITVDDGSVYNDYTTLRSLSTNMRDTDMKTVMYIVLGYTEIETKVQSMQNEIDALKFQIML